MSPQMPTALLRAQSDERLARLAALGNERAFEAIVERYRRPLIGYARRLVGDSRAEDVVQAAFVNAWAKMRDGVEVRELRAWLFRIVHNGAVNQLKRASSSDVELLDTAAEPRRLEDDVERRETMRAALGEIAQLPEPQRIALIGSVVQGRRNREIGDELGVTEGAVKMLVHRARSSVRAAAAAFVPFPLLVKLTGGSAGAGAGATAGGAGASAGAGASLLGGTALKAAAVVACAGVVGTAGPTIVKQAVTSSPSSGAAQAASAHGASALHAPAAAGDLARAAAARPVHRPARRPARRPHRAIRRAAPAPAPTVVAAVPAPAVPAPAAAPAPAAPVEEHDASAKLPDRRFIAPAEADDDIIDVPEDPPDPALGEQPIPKDGVPDAIANTINMDTPDQPDDAAAQPDTPDNPPADPADLAGPPPTP